MGRFWLSVPTSFYYKGYITAPKFGMDGAVIMAHIQVKDGRTVQCLN